MIIDAHTHIWVTDAKKYPWQPVGGYIPEKEASVATLLRQMDAAGVERAVLVQPTPYGWDNSYLIDSFQAYPDRLRAVGLVDPHSPGATAALRRLVEQEGIKGVRINWNLEPDHAWHEDDSQKDLWRALQSPGIPVCLQFTPQQVEMVKAMARSFPKVQVVLDHLGRPRPGNAPDDPEFQAFLGLAENANIYAKLSGLYYFSNQEAPFQDTWGLLQAVVRAFGAQRCLWGSDFPFINERWSYTALLDTIREKLDYAAGELEWILGRTASLLGW
jgi:predicted TIM-barrel fold metal-dependent hydrolase